MIGNSLFNSPDLADLQAIPWYGWVAIILLLGSQGTWLFLDARRHGARAWFWGLLGLIQFPCPTLFYWYFVRRVRRS